AMKWENEDLVVYEIVNDEVKRVQKVWPEVVKYFDRDWQTRFLKKYPKEGEGDNSYTFVSDRDDIKNFEFKGDKLLLDIFAENKPNLAPGPHWSAELRGCLGFEAGQIRHSRFQTGQDRSPQRTRIVIGRSTIVVDSTRLNSNVRRRLRCCVSGSNTAKQNIALSIVRSCAAVRYFVSASSATSASGVALR